MAEHNAARSADPDGHGARARAGAARRPRRADRARLGARAASPRSTCSARGSRSSRAPAAHAGARPRRSCARRLPLTVRRVAPTTARALGIAGDGGALLARPDGTPASVLAPGATAPALRAAVAAAVRVRRLGSVGTRNIPIAEAGPPGRGRDAPRSADRGAGHDGGRGARAVREPARAARCSSPTASRFLGAVTRESLPATPRTTRRSGRSPTARGLRIAPGEPVQRAHRRDRPTRGLDRIPVVDGDALVGLICFNSRHGHFCVDG